MDLNQELNRTYGRTYVRTDVCTDVRTDGRTDKGNTICRFHYRGRDIKIKNTLLLPTRHGLPTRAMLRGLKDLSRKSPFRASLTTTYIYTCICCLHMAFVLILSFLFVNPMPNQINASHGLNCTCYQINFIISVL